MDYYLAPFSGDNYLSPPLLLSLLRISDQVKFFAKKSRPSNFLC